MRGNWHLPSLHKDVLNANELGLMGLMLVVSVLLAGEGSGAEVPRRASAGDRTVVGETHRPAHSLQSS